MPYVVADRVKESTTTTGTGNITLSGAVTGFKTFSSTVGVGNTTTYVITDFSGGQWEVGLGTLSGSTTLVRTQVFSNSMGNTNFVNFSAGTKTVFVTMSAAPRNNNVAFGNNLGFSPQTYQYTTVVGDSASVGNDYATAVGQFAVANGSNGVAVGGGASAGGSSSTALGQQANSGGGNSVAVGVQALASASSSVAVGQSANATGNTTIAIGVNPNASFEDGIAIGRSNIAYDSGSFAYGGISIGAASNTYGGITIGRASTASSSSAGTDAIIIGHGITALENDATYMNKFRTSVTPVGAEWALRWDDSTKEVYAVPAIPPVPSNWYTYQSVAAGTFSLPMPSGMPTTSFGGGATLWSAGATSSSVNPTGVMWSFAGGTAYYSGVYSAFSPAPDPETYSGTATGIVIVYYSGYETDAGASNTQQVNTGTTLYSSFSNNLYCNTFAPFGSTRYGHAIVVVNGSVAGTFVPASGVTLVEDFYDVNAGYTYAFFDFDTTAVGNASAGLPFASYGGFSTYETIFWYNYS